MAGNLMIINQHHPGKIEVWELSPEDRPICPIDSEICPIGINILPGSSNGNLTMAQL
jgi:hypothetical protein